MRSVWPLERCPWPGRARSSAIGTPARPSFDRRWRNTPVKATSSSLPLYRGLLAEIEAESGGAEAALAGIDGALALAGETGEHWFDAGLHRIRGEILLKQNPADPAPAEAAFLAAIAVAQQQKARSFELRAALSLAKLYQSTGRPTDAHDVLGPALAGFSPTPEFPEIAEAQELLAPSRPSPICECVVRASSGRFPHADVRIAYQTYDSPLAASWRLLQSRRH